MLKQSLKLIGVWFVSYVGMWITKLVITSIFTDQNALASAWGSAAARLGIVKDTEFMFRYDKFAAIISAFKRLFDWPMLYAFGGLVVIAGIVMVFLRAKQREWYARGAVMLVVAFLPILWIMVGTHPMIMHTHFQYRILAVTMLGGMYFWLMAVERNRLPDVKSLNGSDRQE